MKNRMLLVSNSPTTSTGIRSYLEPIFRGYVELEAKMTADVTARMMEQFDLVLFASKEAQKELAKQLTPKIHYLTCIRTFNHTYLNRILVIPPGARVYLVNDSESTTIDSINMLNDFGITQYEWVPWYPGREDLDYTISYAVTLGEGRFVPKHIPTVIDIGARIADISTISEIASFFHLPMGLADLVTKNYINQFVQLLKISNHQLSQAANTRFVTQSIIGNISSGVCILSGDGEVSMVNESFLLAMRTKKSNLVGLPFAEAFPEITGKYGTDLSQYPPFLTVHPDGEASLELGFQEIEDIRHQKQFLIHCLGQETGRAVGETREHTPVYYNFSDYRSVNGGVLQMLETAKRISLTNYRLLIQGETGTGKEVLAQAIHNNSSRSQYPFVKLNLSAMSEEQAFEELKGDAVLKRVGRGTLYLDGIETLTKGLQREVMRILDSNPDIRFTASSGENLYALCQDGRFQKELFYRINEVSLETLPLRKRPEDIPMLFEYFLRNIYSNPALTWGELFSEVLCQRLMEYRWPGNGKEVENLCKYFYCVKTDRKLTSRDLPPYILSQLAEKQGKLSPMDRELLLAISQNPKAGRARLYQILKEKGIEVTEGKVRGMLISLADRDLIKMNRTRGGCEITEDGEILSQSYLSFR